MSTFTTHIPFVEMLGMELVSFDAGRAEIGLTLREELSNSRNMAHGGVLMTLLDVAMAHAARSPNQPGMGETHGVVTIEMKTSFMRPGVGRLLTTGEVLHRTASTAFCEGRIRDEAGALVAQATGTFRYVRPLPPAAGPTARPARRLDASE